MFLEAMRQQGDDDRRGGRETQKTGDEKMQMYAAPKMWSALTALVCLLVGATAAPAVTINIGSAIGAPGSTVTIQATVSTMGDQVGGVENDLTFDPETPLAADCQLSSRFANSLSSIGLKPDGCTLGVDCGVRAIVFTFPAAAIPDGTLLYTCSLHIAADAPLQTFPITCSNPSAGTPPGAPLQAQCANGQVQVALATPTPTPGPAGGGGGGGCEIGSSARAQGVQWPLWILAVAPLWLWRQRRLRRNPPQ